MMIRRLYFIFLMMSLLASLFGCGGNRSTAKSWQKAKPLTEDLDHPNALASDDKFIYFVTGGTVASQHEGTNNVMKMPIGGGAPTVIFKGGDIIPDAEALALDDEYLYFSADGLRRVAKTGGEATLLTQAFMTSEIVVDKENVYWMPYVGEGMTPAPVYAVAKKGGETKAITDRRPTANGLCVDDKFVYWIQTDGIYKTGKQGGSIEKIYTMPDSDISSDLRNDSDNFYFLHVKSNNLMKLAKSGGEPTLLAKGVARFWVGKDEIVFQRWVHSFDMSIYKVDKNGTGETELDTNGYLAGLTIGKDRIFLSDISKIYELAK